MRQAEFSNKFLKNLSKTDEKLKEEIKKRIRQILINPHSGIPLKKPLKPLFKLRYSNYRIIYYFDDKFVYVQFFQIY